MGRIFAEIMKESSIIMAWVVTAERLFASMIMIAVTMECVSIIDASSNATTIVIVKNT